MTTNFKTSVLRESVVSLMPAFCTSDIFISPALQLIQYYKAWDEATPTVWKEHLECEDLRSHLEWNQLLLQAAPHEPGGQFPLSNLITISPSGDMEITLSPVSALCHLISVMCPASLQNASRTIKSPGWLLQPLHLRGFQLRCSQQILTGRTIE